MSGDSIAIPHYHAAKSQLTFHLCTAPENPPSYIEVAFTGQSDDPAWYTLVRYTEIPMYRSDYTRLVQHRPLDRQEEIGMIWHALRYVIGDNGEFYAKARIRYAQGNIGATAAAVNMHVDRNSRIYTWKPGQFFTYSWMLKNSRPAEDTEVRCTCVLAQ